MQSFPKANIVLKECSAVWVQLSDFITASCSRRSLCWQRCKLMAIRIDENSRKSHIHTWLHYLVQNIHSYKPVHNCINVNKIKMYIINNIKYRKQHKNTKMYNGKKTCTHTHTHTHTSRARYGRAGGVCVCLCVCVCVCVCVQIWCFPFFALFDKMCDSCYICYDILISIFTVLHYWLLV